MRNDIRRHLVWIALGSVIAGSCRAAPDGTGAAERGLRSGTTVPAAPLDTVLLREALEYAASEASSDLKAVVVLHDGHVVAAEYYKGHGRDSLLDVRSVGKSITSILVGMAIADGRIAGVDAPVFPLLQPAGRGSGGGDLKERVTVEHLLTMTSGLDADDDDPGSAGAEDRLQQSSDWTAFALAVPMRRPPGEAWVYASVNTFLVGLLIETIYDRPLVDFARERLFEPLGINAVRWASSPDNRTVAQGNIFLRAIDMARIGQLYLDGGRWQDAQILPAEWVTASTVSRAPVDWADYDSFGYSWFLHEVVVQGHRVSYFAASGNGGNKIYVVLDRRVVVAVQSVAYNTRRGHTRSLEILRRILASIPRHDPG